MMTEDSRFDNVPISVQFAQARMFEVRAAAKWCARHGYDGGTGDPLPNLLSSRACTWIDGNIRAFREMVKAAQ